MMQRSSGKGKECHLHIHIVLTQFFKFSLRAGVALKIPRRSICSITPECASWTCYAPSAFSFFFSSFSPIFSKFHSSVWDLLGSKVQVRSGSCAKVEIRCFSEHTWPEEPAKNIEIRGTKRCCCKRKNKRRDIVIKLLSCFALQRTNSLFPA